MKRTNVNMLSGSIPKGLLAMTMPIMVMNVTQNLFNIIDMTVLGQLVGDNAVGSVGACSMLITLCTCLLIGIAAGTVTSLAVVFILCKLFGLDDQLTVSLLPKSITTAMGIVLSGQNGGIPSLTTAAIIFSGILGTLIGSGLCKLLKLKDPISQGVAFGTASHVIGTSKASELGSLQGAVSSLSLTVAGILTAVLFPIVCALL